MGMTCKLRSLNACFGNWRLRSAHATAVSDEELLDLPEPDPAATAGTPQKIRAMRNLSPKHLKMPLLANL